MLCTSVLPMFHTVIPVSAYRLTIWRKPSVVRRSGVDPTLTYAAPICLRNSSCSSVGLAEDCAHSLIPGAMCRPAANFCPAEPRNTAAPNVAARDILPNSLRSGLIAPPSAPLFASRSIIDPSPLAGSSLCERRPQQPDSCFEPLTGPNTGFQAQAGDPALHQRI